MEIIHSATNDGSPEDERIFHKLLRDACQELGITFKKMSYNWIIELSKNHKIRHIIGNRFDLNPQAAGAIASDKYATYSVLISQNIPVAEHVMLFNPATRTAYIPENGNDGIVQELLSQYGSIVIKPNDGCKGKGVSLCDNLKEANHVIQSMFQSGSNDLVICPYYNIKTEYRTFYLNHEIILVYGKSKPFVIGNGVDSLGQLVKKLDLPHNAIVENNLEKFDLSIIPENGEQIELSWKHNLSGGATARMLVKEENPDLFTKLEELALQTGKVMNLNFCSIDIIQTQDDKLRVLEVNSGIGTAVFVKTIEGGYEIIKEMFKKALKIMFEE